MDNVSVRKIELIITDLLSEFEKEGGKLQAEYDDNAVRIIEIEENIHNFKENEDTDFVVFSPRKIDNHNEEKINSLKEERQRVELSNKSLYRQMRYYSDKIEKLNEILSILDNCKDEETNKVSKPFEDIMQVDEKILEYYDSIISKSEESADAPEGSADGRRGWRVIKDELDNPVTAHVVRKETAVDNYPDRDSEEIELVVDRLTEITGKLETESKAIDDDYFRTKEEIRKVLNSINDVLDRIKK